ncbi:tRNA dihydrouridine synthase [Glugoides intestinalis]
MEKSQFMIHLNSMKKPWKFLAPMVGNSEEAYRILARKHGADVCYTEMVNCKAFTKNKCNPTNNQWYTTSPEDRPLVIQICGDDPEVMLQTCLSIQSYCEAIDINFGCPQEIARKGHYGSYLQEEWDLVYNIVSVCSKGIEVPLFCKIRVFESIEKSVEYAKVFERAGASLLVVHGRTREQRGENTGLASWEHIKAIKAALKIPVIANGNLIYNYEIERCFKETNCDGVMIAEPHLFNPAIFCTESMSSIEVAEEYLAIAASEIRLFDGGSAKSHFFKIFHTLLLKMPDLRIKLDKSKRLDDYKVFCIMVRELLESNEISNEDLKMHPYIRGKK